MQSTMRTSSLWAASTALVFGVLALPSVGRAHTGVGTPTQGMLLVAQDSGDPLALPLKNTRVTAYIAGFVASVKVQQSFNNPFDDPLEAIYVFPLPDSAAVNGMTIRVGNRTIRGAIKKRKEAREAYDKARSEGKTAALLDQERPNIFTQSVANILPKKEVFVEITYDVQLEYSDGRYEFAYPMVVGPRYIAGTPDGKPTKGEGTSPDTDKVPDASKITPPPVEPGMRSGRNVSIDITIDPGMKIHELESPTHTIDVDTHKRSHMVNVGLASANEIPNKDFVIRYSLASKQPAMSVLAYKREDSGYFSLLFEPPAKTDARDVTSKEVFFVVDTSGSMSGEPIKLARRAMLYAIKNLNPNDTFQIIRFSSSASQLSSTPLANTPANVKRAVRYIKNMSGGGGTEMIKGVRAALDENNSEGRLRIVCLMTDGYIGNETEILGEIEDQLGGDTRLFSLGVGSSVNRYLLERMAEVGRGTAQYILNTEKPADQVATFYRRIQTPVLTHVEIDWGKLGVVDQSPAAVPDLFSGQPLRVVGRFDRRARGSVTIRGRVAGKTVSYKVPVSLVAEESNELVPRLWARSRIRELSREQLRSADADIENEITRLGLEYKLMTRYTSFVAVDKEKVVDVDARTYMVPVEVPDGVDYGKAYPPAVDPGELRVTKAGIDEDSAGEAEYGGESIALASSVAGRMRLLARRGLTVGIGFGIGGTTLGDADDSRFAGSLSLRVDRIVGNKLALGAQGALLLNAVDGAPNSVSVLADAAYLDILRGWLNIVAGIGPSISTDGDLGLALMGALKLNTRTPVGLQLRWDAIVGPQATESSTVTFGVELSF